jgi:hypothetical protein
LNLDSGWCHFSEVCRAALVIARTVLRALDYDPSASLTARKHQPSGKTLTVHSSHFAWHEVRCGVVATSKDRRNIQIRYALVIQLLTLLAVANGTPVIAAKILGKTFAYPVDFSVEFCARLTSHLGIKNSESPKPLLERDQRMLIRSSAKFCKAPSLRTCVYRQPRPERSGDEVRQVSHLIAINFAVMAIVINF